MANGPSPPAIGGGPSGFSRWLTKAHSRYDGGEDYAFSPPEEGSFFSLNFGPSVTRPQKSTFEKLNEELGFKEGTRLSISPPTPPVPPPGYMRPRRDSLLTAKAELALGEKSVTQITEQFLQEAQLARSFADADKEDANDELAPLQLPRYDGLAGYGPSEDLCTLRERLSKLSVKSSHRSTFNSPNGSPKILRKTSEPSTPFELEVAHMQPQPSNIEQPHPYIGSRQVSTDTPVLLPPRGSGYTLDYYKPSAWGGSALAKQEVAKSSALAEIGNCELKKQKQVVQEAVVASGGSSAPPPPKEEPPMKMGLLQRIFAGHASTPKEMSDHMDAMMKEVGMPNSIYG